MLILLVADVDVVAGAVTAVAAAAGSCPSLLPCLLTSALFDKFENCQFEFLFLKEFNSKIENKLLGILKKLC